MKNADIYSDTENHPHYCFPALIFIPVSQKSVVPQGCHLPLQTTVKFRSSAGMYSTWLNVVFLFNIKTELAGLANRVLWNGMRKLRLFDDQHRELVLVLKILVYSDVN